jgi:hypothetical protein
MAELMVVGLVESMGILLVIAMVVWLETKLDFG